jgi:hypothetical protein
MNSSFTTHYIQSLATSTALPELSSDAQLTSKKQNLQSLVSLKQPLSRSETRDTLHSLQRIERDNAEISTAQADKEEYALRRAVLGKIVIGLYAEALDTYLTEANEAETEAEWWADVERSRRNVAYYFVQSEYLLWPLFEYISFGANAISSLPASTAGLDSYHFTNSSHPSYSSNPIYFYSVVSPSSLSLRQCFSSKRLDNSSIPSSSNPLICCPSHL